MADSEYGLGDWIDDGVFDSRTITERIEALDGTEDESEQDELATLRAFAAEAEPYITDWQYGETIIREDHFRDYAEELAEDIGSVDKDAPWPQTFIDWDAAAEALKIDYTAIEFGGVTYYAR